MLYASEFDNVHSIISFHHSPDDTSFSLRKTAEVANASTKCANVLKFVFKNHIKIE